MNRNDHDNPAERPVVLAVIGAAHGIRGDVRVRSYTEDPEAFGAYGSLAGSDGRRYRVVSARPAGNVVIVHFAGINDRTAAEALNGVELSVPRSALPAADPDEEEYFHADLIGLVALDADGVEYGRIVAIHDFGGGDMLEIQRPGMQSRMIPFTSAAVPKIEIGAGRIILDPAAAGMTDTEED